MPRQVQTIAVRSQAGQGQMPNCRCTPPRESVQRTVRKEGPNTGRVFYVCSKAQNDATKCRFFEWGDAGAPAGVGGVMGAFKNRNSNQQPRNDFFAPRGKGNGVTLHPNVIQQRPVFSNAQGNDSDQKRRNNFFAPRGRGTTAASHSNGVQQRPFFSISQGNGCTSAIFPNAGPGANPGNAASAQISNGRSRELENGPVADVKRPRIHIGPSSAAAITSVHQISNGKEKVGGAGQAVTFALATTETVRVTMSASWNKDIISTLREVDGVTVKNTAAIGMQEVFVPLRKLKEVERLLSARHSKRVEFSFPRVIVERLQSLREEHDSREARGDVVSRPLNEILPAIVCDALMDFQWEGIHFALKRGGRCLIGDDMGLGKTLQAIAVARIYIEDWPLLVVCPSSLRLNWKEELLKWLGDDLDEEDISVIMKGADCSRPFRRVNIVSYDLIRKIRQSALDKCKFIIADESHYLKSGAAKRSQTVTPIIMRAKRALLLSGTPALSRPVELFQQINSLLPTLFPKFNEFTERYCNAHLGRFGYDVSGASNLNELYELLRGSVLIRRKKDDVLTQLPAKRRQVLWVETKPKPMKEVKAAFKELELAQAAANRVSGDAAEEYRNVVRSIQTKLYQLTASAKLDSILEFIKDTAETGCKFIVFAHHGETIDAVDDYLAKKLKLKFIRIDGKTPQAQRQTLCKSFQGDPKCRVSLLSITAAGVGLTLTAATVVLFAELYWNPGSLLQAEDRAHRIGQRDCVLVKYLLAKKTLDETMWGSVRRKFNVIGKSLTGAAGVIEVNSQTQKEDGDSPDRPKGYFSGKETQEDVQDRPDFDSLENTQKPIATVDLTQEVIDVDDSPVAKNRALHDIEMFPTSVEVGESVSTTPVGDVDADIAFAKKLRRHLDVILD